MFKFSKKTAIQSNGSFPMEEAKQRYNEWLHSLRTSDLLSREFLLPLLRVPCPLDLPALMTSGDRISEPSDPVLKKSIQKLSPWGYGIQLRKGVSTGPPVALERMIYRSHLISGAVRRLLGGDLAHSTFIDFAV